MAVPKPTQTRCRYGSVQARQVIKRLHKQPHPYTMGVSAPSLHRESTDSLIYMYMYVGIAGNGQLLLLHVNAQHFSRSTVFL